jgi:hypothetical protein
MTEDLVGRLERVLAARLQLLAVRSQRAQVLLRLGEYLRSTLGDFLVAIDPVGGQRLAEINVTTNRSAGTVAVVLAFFDGTSLRIAVDARGRLEHETAPPGAIGEIARIVEIGVTPDGTRAALAFQRSDAADAVETLDFAEIVDRLVGCVAERVEGEVPASFETAAEYPGPVPEPVPPRLADVDADVASQTIDHA